MMGRRPVRARPRVARFGVFALALTMGCETTATIRRPDGPPFEAEIDYSTESELVLRGADGSSIPLGQYQVSEVDHPGNVLAVVGGFYLGVGGLSLWYLHEQRGSCAPDCSARALALMMGACGILSGLVFATNLLIWSRSKTRARRFEDSRPPAWLIPPPAQGDLVPVAPVRSLDFVH